MTEYGYHIGKINTCPKPLFDKLKSVGFSAVLFHMGGEYPAQSIADDIVAAGLEIENVHGPMTFVNEMWIPGSEGDEVAKRWISEMELCASIGVKRIVYHVSAGNNYPPIHQCGIDRFSRMAEAAERLDIDMCLENQRFFHFIDYIYANIDSNHLKFCYDSGHEACFSQTKLALPKYRNRLAALHLHDNDGVYNHDQHLFPGSSTGVDWDYVRKNLEGYNGRICLELGSRKDMPFDEFLEKAIASARFVKEDRD